MYSRRARPTLRLMREDLSADWSSPYARNCLDRGDHLSLLPLSELDHPLIAKALECFGTDPARDNSRGPIQCATNLRLAEVRVQQWRGAVWEDSDGVNWLVAAGLAKGAHQDRDDFYEWIKRLNDQDSLSQILPEDEDIRLLKTETLARLTTEWELTLQRQTLEALTGITGGGSAQFEFNHPLAGLSPNLSDSDKVVATVQIRIDQNREDAIQTDDILVEFIPRHRWLGSKLLDTAIIRVLAALFPPEQDWDSSGLLFSNIAAPGEWINRASALNKAVSTYALIESRPGQVAHYTHRKHIAGKAINGAAVRGLCGRFFVPTQDHESLDACPDCEQIYSNLPS